ncbi:uncharacterized protein FFE2_00722 [Fusarium fujikuroi]|nr:uncharacterized protein FFE2_00722 [Fusarium fujikuroi]
MSGVSMSISVSAWARAKRGMMHHQEKQDVELGNQADIMSLTP